MTQAIDILSRERDQLIDSIRSMKRHMDFLVERIDHISAMRDEKIAQAKAMTDAMVELGWRKDESHSNS